MQMQTNRTHNEFTLMSLEEGDLVKFDRGLYSHWGVYVGDEDIVHLYGDDGDISDDASVRIDNFWKIVKDSKAFKNNKDNKRRPLRPGEIVKNALSRIGEVGYNLITRNCEHFANWCRYGEEKSDQVDNVLTGIAVGAAALATIGLVAAISQSSKEKQKQKK